MNDKSKRILELVLVGLIGLVIVFIGARLVWYGRALDQNPKWNSPNQIDQKMTIPGRPHNVAMLLRDPDSIGRRLTYTYSTNSHSFRGPDFATAKPAGVYRIASVGECVTFGQGVFDDETWTAQLGEKLSERYPDRAIETLNIGRPGPFDQVEKLFDIAMDFDPDLVLLAPGTDTGQLHGFGANEDLRRGGGPDTISQDFQTRLTALVDATRARGMDLVLVTPTFNSFAPPKAMIWVDGTRAVADRMGVPLVDTTAMFREAEARSGLVFESEGSVDRVISHASAEPRVIIEVPSSPNQIVAQAIYEHLDDNDDVGPLLSIDDNHPNPRGHELIAGAVFETIVGAGYLEDPR